MGWGEVRPEASEGERGRVRGLRSVGGVMRAFAQARCLSPSKNEQRGPLAVIDVESVE